MIEITDEPIEKIEHCQFRKPFEIGELMVRGDVVTERYVTRTDANALHKVDDGDSFWHRMGDVGYLDDQERFWFCGRKGHRVTTSHGTMYTIPCEAIFNTHEKVYRSALVGVGNDDDKKMPVLVVECWPEFTLQDAKEEEALILELRNMGQQQELTQTIQNFLLIDKMPVDIRHNSKIFREKLTVWAESKIFKSSSK